MTIIGLLIAVLATVMVVYLDHQGKLPPPIGWVLYGVLIVVWLWILLVASGFGGGWLSQPIT